MTHIGSRASNHYVTNVPMPESCPQDILQGPPWTVTPAALGYRAWELGRIVHAPADLPFALANVGSSKRLS
jgi:hypothetical protein